MIVISAYYRPLGSIGMWRGQLFDSSLAENRIKSYAGATSEYLAGAAESKRIVKRESTTSCYGATHRHFNFS